LKDPPEKTLKLQSSLADGSWTLKPIALDYNFEGAEDLFPAGQYGN
jgi:hypothetical protein